LAEIISESGAVKSCRMRRRARRSCWSREKMEKEGAPKAAIYRALRGEGLLARRV